INIQLKKASADAMAGKIDVNGGSYGSFEQNLNLKGTLDKLSYMLSLNNSQSDGFSAAAESQPDDNFDQDGFKRNNALARIGYAFNDRFNLEVMSVYNTIEAEYDDAAYLDGDNVLKSDELRFGIKPRFSYNKGNISLHAVYNVNHNDFQDSYPVKYEGRNLQADLINEHQFTDALKGLFGINLQQASYEEQNISSFDDNNFLIIDPYASLLYESNFGFNVHIGTRLNNHNEYGSHFIYNVNPSYIFDVTNAIRLKLRGSVSTAFITPSLYQLYSFVGNTDLKPEESTNYDAGLSLYISQALSFNATYFIRDEEEVIDFVSQFDEQGNYVGGAYQNLQQEREIKGIELQMDWKIVRDLNFNAYFSQIDRDNSSTFYRIPENKWGFELAWQPLEEGNLSLKYKRTGERTDIDFVAGSDVVLDPYTVVDAYADYQFFKKLKVYGAVNNLFDEQFVTVWGFNTKGRNYNVGVSYTF
ncbi:MAG: TonB-dependent receptor, partial [Fulvivirga sp.]